MARVWTPLLPRECRFESSQRHVASAPAIPIPAPSPHRSRAPIPQRYRRHAAIHARPRAFIHPPVSAAANRASLQFQQAPLQFIGFFTVGPLFVPVIPGALNVPILAGNEIVRIGTFGSRDAQTTAAAIAALASVATTTENYVFLGAMTSFTLPDGTVVGQRVGIKDNNRTAASVLPVINGHIEGATSFHGFNQNGAAYEFVWNGTDWSVF